MEAEEVETEWAILLKRVEKQGKGKQERVLYKLVYGNEKLDFKEGGKFKKITDETSYQRRIYSVWKRGMNVYCFLLV